MNIKQKTIRALCLSLAVFSGSQLYSAEKSQEKKAETSYLDPIRNFEYKKHLGNAFNFLKEHTTTENGQFDSNHIVGAITGATFSSHPVLSIFAIVGTPFFSPFLAQLPYVKKFFAKQEKSRLEMFKKQIKAQIKTSKLKKPDNFDDYLKNAKSADQLATELPNLENCPDELKTLAKKHQTQYSFMGRLKRSIAGGVVGYSGAFALNTLSNIL